MPRLAVLAGHTLLGTQFAAEAEPVEVATLYGSVALRDAGDFVYLQRHGFDGYAAPHAIDHRANVAALAEADCDRVLALGSVGSLRMEIEVGTLIAPDDYISMVVRASGFDDARGHVVPGFDADWRRRILAAFAAAGEPLRDGGVYWQSGGPRFETPAEVRVIAPHGDVVGMTIGSEATIARELGLAYAVACNVDNYANGVAPRALTLAEYETGKASNRDRVLRALGRVVPDLADPGAGPPA
jgi:5'-methylthioadenosine phosphorylase